MATHDTQTVSGTLPAITREGLDVVLNWEAKASVKNGKEVVHVHSWATDSNNNPARVYQFYGNIVSPQLGDHGQFRSDLNVLQYEADVATFDVPEPTDIGLQVGMLLSEENTRDQSITDVANINFARTGA